MTVKQTQSAQIPTQKQLLAIALPNTLAALAVPLAELVDLAFLGHLDDVNQLSGVVLATVIFDYIYWSFGFLRMGTTGLVAQALGSGNSDEQAALFWRGTLLAVFFGILLTLLQLPIAAFSFALLTGGTSVEEAGNAYYYAHIWGAIPTLINYVCIGWLLGQSKAGSVFLVSLVWQGANIILDYWFIVLNGWGAAGAGYAIMLAEWLGMLTALVCVYRCWGGVPPLRKESLFNWPRIRQLMALNSSILIRTFLLVSTLAAFTNISATFGSIILAGNAILLRLFITSAYVIDGFAVALETLGGLYYGNRNRDALRRSFKLTMRWNYILTTAFVLSYWAGSNWIFHMLTEHDEVITHASTYLPWLLLTLVAGGFAFVYDGFFLGLAKPGLLMKSMVISCLSFVPFGFAGHYLQSVNWLWAGMACFIAARAFTLAVPAKQYLSGPLGDQGS